MFTYKNEIKSKTYSEILKVFFNILSFKKDILEKKETFSEMKIKKFIQRQYKKTLIFKPRYIRYKRYFSFLLRKLKYRKKKKKKFKN
jgi:hypothetical protein